MSTASFWRTQFYPGLVFWLCLTSAGISQTPSKDLCGDPRDIVFIVDQSGTMVRNDPEGMRWALIKYALKLRGKVAPNSDRVAVIPFGGKSETDDYVRQNYPPGEEPQWYELAQPYSGQWLLRKVPTQLSDTTDIFSAFDYFNAHFCKKTSTGDLFIFFISDGLVDLLPSKPVKRQKKSERQKELEEEHNQRLLQLLEGQSERWRLYNICLGDSVNVGFHQDILAKIKIDRRKAGGLYPAFAGSVPGNPFLLVVNDPDSSKRWLKIESAITQVLQTHGASQYIPEPMRDGVTDAPSLGSVTLRLRVKIKPVIEAATFQNRLRVSFFIANAAYNVKLNLENAANIDNVLTAFDFTVDSLDVFSQLKSIRKTPNDIGNWQIVVHGLDPGQTVEKLEVLYKHGWILQIDKLAIGPDSSKGRSFFRKIFGMAERCEPVLHFHAKVQNVCGEKLPDTTALLKILNNAAYPLEVRQTKYTDNSVGDEYEWSAVIRDNSYLLSKLGETVTVSAFVAGRRFIFETSTVPVKVCAKY